MPEHQKAWCLSCHPALQHSPKPGVGERGLNNISSSLLLWCHFSAQTSVSMLGRFNNSPGLYSSWCGDWNKVVPVAVFGESVGWSVPYPCVFWHHAANSCKSCLHVWETWCLGDELLVEIENNVLCGEKCTDYSPRQSIGACIPWYVPKVFFIGPTLSDLIKGRIFKNWILAFFCFVFLESVYFFVLFSEAILCKTFFVFCTGHYYCKHCK